MRDGTQEAHFFNTTLRYEHSLARLLAFSETTVEVDRGRLKYRLSQSAGLSFSLFKSEQSQLGLNVGTGLSREVYNNGIRQNLATSLMRATAEQKIGDKVKLNQQLTFFSNLFRPSQARLEAEASVTLPLTEHLALQLASVNRYNRRPQAGAQSNDLSLLTGFKFVF